MIITRILPSSSAAKKGLLQGDTLVSMNGLPINDQLDFFLYAAYLPLTVVTQRNGSLITTEFNTYRDVMKLGIEVEDLKIKHCGNKCVFCFVDQNPKGLRKSLYIKDEDYRYSYLYGSFCTLSNITQKELARIVQQHLSPLYISVHAFDTKTRLRLLGLKKDDHLWGKIKFLTDNGIAIHAQIVLCPGINDGKILINTIEKLHTLFPYVLSVAVVPLGKTRHREKITNLRSITGSDAKKSLSAIQTLQQKYRRETCSRFVFAADEFYLLSKTPLPRHSEYEGYPQYENGVGMIRYFLNEFNTAKKSLPQKARKPLTLLIVTSKSFHATVKRSVLPALNKIKNISAHAVAAENHLFGPEITVAGLLSGADMIRAVKDSGIKADVIIVPDTCLNFNGVTLDDMKLSDIARTCKAKVHTSDKLMSLKELI
jgi:putative radical SAM enzyme (TIGR03279 family)